MLAGPDRAVLFPIACLIFDLSRFVLLRSALYTSGGVVPRDDVDFPPLRGRLGWWLRWPAATGLTW
jgi:hypothetical protein